MLLIYKLLFDASISGLHLSQRLGVMCSGMGMINVVGLQELFKTVDTTSRIRGLVIKEALMSKTVKLTAPVINGGVVNK
jgi:hypothetical protein